MDKSNSQTQNISMSQLTLKQMVWRGREGREGKPIIYYPNTSTCHGWNKLWEKRIDKPLVINRFLSFSMSFLHMHIVQLSFDTQFLCQSLIPNEVCLTCLLWDIKTITPYDWLFWLCWRVTKKSNRE
jgi:hypothetical protein